MEEIQSHVALEKEEMLPLNEKPLLMDGYTQIFSKAGIKKKMEILKMAKQINVGV